jgi:hypothetical protein
MINRPAPSEPHLAGRSISRTRRTLATFGGLAVFLTAAFGFAPAASAVRLPPPGGAPVAPPPPPATTAAAHFPLWAVIAMVAATVVLSVATTLVTLSLDHLRRARRTPAVAADPQAHAQTPSITAGPKAEQGELLTGHHYVAGHDVQAGGR